MIPPTLSGPSVSRPIAVELRPYPVWLTLIRQVGRIDLTTAPRPAEFTTQLVAAHDLPHSHAVQHSRRSVTAGLPNSPVAKRRGTERRDAQRAAPAPRATTPVPPRAHGPPTTHDEKRSRIQRSTSRDVPSPPPPRRATIAPPPQTVPHATISRPTTNGCLLHRTLTQDTRRSCFPRPPHAQ